MKNKQKYKVVGLMSGTSLDGLDMAYCEFQKASTGWSFKLLAYDTKNYTPSLLQRLRNSPGLTGMELAILDKDLGQWMGEQVRNFMSADQEVDLIASHGHTVFHQPDKRLTLQIGNGNVMAAVSQQRVIYDFRSLDVALGGQGAPLVPIGDQLLFHEYGYCLNLGGIANISFDQLGTRRAFDICPCNMALNYLANKLNQDYDRGGKRAAGGKLIPELLEQLNALAFYKQQHPKSLGFEWVSENVFPLLDQFIAPVESLMHTMVEHIALQIAASIQEQQNKTRGVLVTGGGAYHQYLMDRVEYHLPSSITLHLPQDEVINYKEAMIFGFLGVLRVKEEVNCLASVTGADKDSCGGVIAGYF